MKTRNRTCGRKEPRIVSCARCKVEYSSQACYVKYCNGCRALVHKDTKARHRATHRERKNELERHYYKLKSEALGHPPRKLRKPEWIQKWSHARRARKVNAIGSFTSAEFDRIVKDQHGKCFDCQVTMDKPTVGHKVPLFVGGSNGIWNIMAQCKPCNSKQGVNVHPKADPTIFDLPEIRTKVAALLHPNG